MPVTHPIHPLIPHQQDCDEPKTRRSEMSAVRAEPNGVALAVAEYYPIAKKMAWGDDDLQQELLMSVMDTVGNRKIYDAGLIINRMVLQRKMYKTGYLMVDRNGSSIDRGHVRNRQDVTIWPYDTANERVSRDAIVETDLALYFTDYRSPEETALFNTDYGKFLNCLSVRERAYWDARLEGGIWKDVERLKIANRNEQPALKQCVREKFRKWFEE